MSSINTNGIFSFKCAKNNGLTILFLYGILDHSYILCKYSSISKSYMIGTFKIAVLIKFANSTLNVITIAVLNNFL
jgi:hypothetical protein